MPPITRKWKKWGIGGLFPRGKPRQGDNDDHGVGRHRRQPPLVRGGRGNDRQVDRADDRDHEDRSDGEDDE